MRCFRTVDAREAREVNGEYMGAFQHMTCTSFTNSSTIPIGRIAMDIYNASSPGVLSQDVAQYLWNKGREDDNPIFNSDAIFNPSLDVTIVSWARIECRNPDYMFQPNWFVWCIRVPWHLPESKGLVYFMPQSAQNEITVAVSLRQTDLEKLLGRQNGMKV